MLFALLLLSAAGCASVPVAPPAAPTAPSRLEPPVPPPIRAEPPVVAEVEPIEPPRAATLRIDRRAVYEQARATEWTLANGLTVVYLQSDVDGYPVRVDGDGGLSGLSPALVATMGVAESGPLTATVGPYRRSAVGHAGTLARALASVRSLFEAPADPSSRGGSVAAAFDRPSSFRVFVGGSVDPSWVEAAVADVLATVRARPNPFGPLADDTARLGDGADRLIEAEATWDDAGAVRVLAALLMGRATVAFAPAAGRVTVRAVGDTDLPSLLRDPDEAALRAARDRAAVDAATPAGTLASLADLYTVPGRFRPALNPTEATALADRIARTPPARVAALLRRLAAAPTP